MKKVDLLDLKILQIISVDARVPFKEVAEVCGVSRAAIHQRVQRLTEAGIITGSGYNVYPKHIGYSTCTFVGIKLERGSMYKEVADELVKIPEIVECHFTTGPYTMLIKLYSRDNEHLMELLNNRIQEIPGVISTETLISLARWPRTPACRPCASTPAPCARPSPRPTTPTTTHPAAAARATPPTNRPAAWNYSLKASCWERAHS